MPPSPSWVVIIKVQRPFRCCPAGTLLSCQEIGIPVALVAKVAALTLQGPDQRAAWQWLLK